MVTQPNRDSKQFMNTHTPSFTHALATLKDRIEYNETDSTTK